MPSVHVEEVDIAAPTRVASGTVVNATRSFVTRPVTKDEKEADVDKNGRLDAKEVWSLKQKRAQQKSQDQWKKLDIDKNGVIDNAEFESAIEDSAVAE